MTDTTQLIAEGSMNGEIKLSIEKIGNWEKSVVLISANEVAQKDYAYLMTAAEFLLNVAAKESPAGYEKALQLLVEGARTYTTTNLKQH